MELGLEAHNLATACRYCLHKGSAIRENTISLIGLEYKYEHNNR